MSCAPGSSQSRQSLRWLRIASGYLTLHHGRLTVFLEGEGRDRFQRFERRSSDRAQPQNALLPSRSGRVPGVIAS